MCRQAIKENQKKPATRGTGGKGDSARKRRSGRGSKKVHGAWWREVSARRSGTRQSQATCVMRQAVWGVELDYEDNSTRLGWRSGWSVTCIGVKRGHSRL